MWKLVGIPALLRDAFLDDLFLPNPKTCLPFWEAALARARATSAEDTTASSGTCMAPTRSCTLRRGWSSATFLGEMISEGMPITLPQNTGGQWHSLPSGRGQVTVKSGQASSLIRTSALNWCASGRSAGPEFGPERSSLSLCNLEEKTAQTETEQAKCRGPEEQAH